jgi:hypothetical protein
MRWQLEQLRLATVPGVEGLHDQVRLLIPAVEVLMLAGVGRPTRAAVRALTGLRALDRLLADGVVPVAATVAAADLDERMGVLV